MGGVNDAENAAALEVRRVCYENGLLLDDLQLGRLSEYARLLLEWNSRINLISRKDEGNLWLGHILHSLSPLFRFAIPERTKVVDLGSGGGLPGIPIAVARPGIDVVLLDSIAKKTTALGSMVLQLGLANAHVATGRAEEIARERSHGAAYDIVLARAVAPLVDLLLWARPLLNRGPVKRSLPAPGPPGARGAASMPCLLALKGGDLEGEVRLAKLKRPEWDLAVEDLVFAGSARAGLMEKKLVIATPR